MNNSNHRRLLESGTNKCVSCSADEMDSSIDKEKSESASQNNESTYTLERPLIVLGVNLHHCSPIAKYFILSLSMMVSMCLNGYLQEYITYGWFARKFCFFVTLLHFSGFSALTLFQRGVRSHLGSEPIHRKLPWMYHFVLIILKTLTFLLNNITTSELNYPAKILFKSAGPVVTMIIGVTWFRKIYLLYEYLSVGMLVLGLYIFILGSHQNSVTDGPQWTPYGLVLILLSLLCSSIIPILQEHWIGVYNICHDEILYYTFLGSTALSLLLTTIFGELFTGFDYVWKTGTPSLWACYIMFEVSGFLGAHCSAALTTCCGALISGITFTTRKAITIALSFALFPSRNLLTYQHIIGGVVFISGLLLRSIMREYMEAAYGASYLEQHMMSGISRKYSGFTLND